MRKVITIAICFLVAILLSQIVFGEDVIKKELDEARKLNQKAEKLYSQGRYNEAINYIKMSLDIVEKALGIEHPDVAESLHNLAVLYRLTSRYSEAEPLHKRSLEIYEKTLGKDHPDVATSLNNLAELYRITGRYAEAEPLHKRSLVIREKTLGREHPDVATSLNNLALLYASTGKYAEAEPLHKRALEIREKALSKDHFDVATSINNLAELYRVTGRYSEAEPLYKRSLGMIEKILGSEHPDVATSLNNLALLYESTGRYSEAEPLYKRSLAIKEKALGKDHPDVATSLNNLAELYRNTGRYAEADPLYKRSLEIMEKALGMEHPSVATSLNNLALLYDSTGMYAEAESLYKKSFGIREKALGKEHPDVATSLNNLAELYRVTGRYSEAEPLYKRSLAIMEKALGKEHPYTAGSLNNLALLYESTGRYAEAEPLFKRSLEIYEKALGNEQPSVAASLNNLAVLYARMDKHSESHYFFKRGITVDDIVKENTFLLLNEKQKITYINQKEGTIHGFMSHTVKHMQSSSQSITDTFNAWLKWKGAVAEAQGRYMDAAMQSGDPEIKNKFDELTNIRREIAKMQLSKPDKGSFEDYRNRIAELQKQKETLEAELSRLSKDFALEKTIGRADVKNISEILPKDSTYIDFARIKFYNFKTNKWDKPKYLAFVLIPHKIPEVKLIEIADAEEIEKHVRAYLQEMNKIKTSGETPNKIVLDKAARTIYDIAIKPLEKYIAGKKQLFISPDGNLNLIPFEALVTPDNKYFIENHTINYIAAGRDIIRFTDTNTAKGDALIIADPDYDMGLTERTQVAQAINTTQTLRGSVSRDASTLSFERLPDTKLEADAIEKVLKKKFKVKNYQNKKAIEEVMFSTETPKILHLATHGYFLNDEELKGSKETRGITIKLKEGFEIRDETINIENPMLRSGIVFAGVNASLKAGRDEGMVSAEKILGLNLKGTDLVVLSACETGVGDVKNGEGVFGLKRAFILSGAKTLVMSLWSVPSAETTELMTEFYTLISEGRSKSDALREAKLNMMKKKSNPFYWGAFVMTGKPE
ncbi:MAG: kinesin [Thermodesulfovibrio sp.]|nr:kinesin [Thermodesulfovibrio sp.]